MRKLDTTSDRGDMSIEQGQVNREVEEYERRHQLPELRGKTTKQNQYGRYCRYRYLLQSRDLYGTLDDAGKAKLIDWLKRIKVNVSPQFWIDRDKRGEMALASDWTKPVTAVLSEVHTASRKARKKFIKANRRKGSRVKLKRGKPKLGGAWRPARRPQAENWRAAISNAARSSGLA